MNDKIHLVIPDSHAHPDYNNNRYTWLGKLIADIKPDVVIDIGDWFDLHSLCSYDKGKAAFAKRRYNEDIAAGVEGQDRLLSVLRKSKRKLPRFVRTLGNHERRISRALEYDPILEGTLGLSDLQSKEYRWEEYPFLEPVNIDGIYYRHYHPSGVMGNPIGGDNIGRSLVAKNSVSCTQGHSHLFSHYVTNTIDGKAIHGLSCGVYQDYTADFAKAQQHLWSSGVVVKRGVNQGNYDIEWISIKRIRETYGQS